jgi:hypothetical protein
MDFICVRSISRESHSPLLETQVEEVQFGPNAGLSDHSQEQQIRQFPTPGDVLAKIAGVIAICLGLALVAQLLIAPPPGM